MVLCGRCYAAPAGFGWDAKGLCYECLKWDRRNALWKQFRNSLTDYGIVPVDHGWGGTDHD